MTGSARVTGAVVERIDYLAQLVVTGVAARDGSNNYTC